ncbi:MAG: PAS domain S-box protein [Brumimicrobium sp.]|nr:PAS domain S-box protein [Brumimicrobium sp.]
MELKENIYAVLFESIQEGLILVDHKGKIIDNNSTAEELFGYEKNELKGQKIEILVPNSVRSKHEEHRHAYSKLPVKRSMGSALRLNGERKDGSVFPVEVSLNPFKDDNGEQFVVALISDVTIRREAQEKLEKMTYFLEQKVKERTHELRESEQLYKSIARNFPGGVISIFDRSLRYLFAEGQGLYELGIETEDLIGLDYLERLIPEARKKVKKELELVFEGNYRSFEVEVDSRAYSISAVPLMNESREVDKILVVEKNVTEQKEVARKLEFNLEKERELNELKSRFVSMASHEFRTPLTTINSSAGLILKYHEKKEYDKLEKHISRIKNSVRNLTSILNDFLSLEKLESGNIKADIKEENITAIIREIFDEMSGNVKSGQSLLYFGEENIFFRTDIQLLKNVLINLISNAIKYSPESSKIEVKAGFDESDLEISIRDYGIGIPIADQEKMFSRFFRAGNVLNIEGTGLGLNIVERYLGLLNGSISFRSVEEEGTTFFIKLPKI